MLQSEIKRIVAEALKEDQAWADVTSRALFKRKMVVKADMIAKGTGVISGIPAAIVAFKLMDRRCSIDIHVSDAAGVAPGRKILTVKGDASKILAAERTALNLMQHLSGIASLTREFTVRVKGTRAKICDTRKTLPGLRILEKYAVRCGGGKNHRMDLKSGAMVKDNHLKALFGSRKSREAKNMLLGLRKRLPKNTPLMIEATSKAEVEVALAAQADVIMLDNMPISQIRKAVQQIRKAAKLNASRGKNHPLIEVTGGVTLDNARQIAQCGVDRISIGRLTHSAPALDISLEII